MPNSLMRLLKIATLIKNEEELNSFNILFEAFIKKYSHDEIAPNVFKKNLDYSESENSPYFGNVSEFIKKFPGGLKDWLKHNKSLNELKTDTKKRINHLEDVMKDNELLEELAKLEHEQWAHWTKYMIKNFDDKNVKKWKKEIDTEYENLSEEEKNGDREWATKVLNILKKYKDNINEDQLAENIALKSVNDFIKQYKKNIKKDLK